MLDASNIVKHGNHIDIVTENTLTLEQEKFLAARLVYPSDAAAARKIGLSRGPIDAWKDDPVFRARYDALPLDVRKEAVKALQALFEDAVDAARRGLQSDNERTRAKYVEIIFGFGGLSRSHDINVTALDQTKLLLADIRSAAEDIIDAEVDVLP